MDLHDWIVLLIVAALVVYALGMLLITANYRAKRRHQKRVIRDFMKGDQVS